MATPYLCLSGKAGLCKQGDRGMVEGAVSPPILYRFKIEDYLVWWEARTQFVDEYGFVGRGIIVLPPGRLIHWGCCLEMFYNLVPPWVINCDKTWMWGWGASCVVGRRSRALVPRFLFSVPGFLWTCIIRSRVCVGSFLLFGRTSDSIHEWSYGFLGTVYLYFRFDRMEGRLTVRRIRVSPSIGLAMFL